jgi:hypothetical protein
MNELSIIASLAAVSVAALCISWRLRLRSRTSQLNESSNDDICETSSSEQVASDNTFFALERPCGTAEISGTTGVTTSVSASQQTGQVVVQEASAPGPITILEAFWKGLREPAWINRFSKTVQNELRSRRSSSVVYLVESALVNDGELVLRVRVGVSDSTCEELSLYLSSEAAGQVKREGRCTCHERNCIHQLIAWCVLSDDGLEATRRLLNKGETDKPILLTHSPTPEVQKKKEQQLLLPGIGST